MRYVGELLTNYMFRMRAQCNFVATSVLCCLGSFPFGYDKIRLFSSKSHNFHNLMWNNMLPSNSSMCSFDLLFWLFTCIFLNKSWNHYVAKWANASVCSTEASHDLNNQTVSSIDVVRAQNWRSEKGLTTTPVWIPEVLQFFVFIFQKNIDVATLWPWW